MLQHSEVFEVCLADTEGNMRVGSYNNLTRENKRANKGLSCLSGKKLPYRTNMPDLYVCSFASVVYVL